MTHDRPTTAPPARDTPTLTLTRTPRGTPEAPAGPRPGTPEPPVRLALLPPGSGPHRLDGVWWPHSHDLGRGLPGLIGALDARWPEITRVTVSRTTWRVRPDSLLVDGRVVHINRSAAVPRPNTVCLLSYGVGRCDLLVVPPGATRDEASRFLAGIPLTRRELGADLLTD